LQNKNGQSLAGKQNGEEHDITLMNISVIGAGTMGNGIAHVFAQFGFTVALIDLSPGQLDKAVQTIGRNLDRQVTKGTLTKEQKESVLSRIKVYQEIPSAVANADLVIEAATENEAVKLKLFKELGETCEDHCILASNTSSISITRLGAGTRLPGRVIGMHFMNPVPVMKLVEVVNGYATDKLVTQSISELAKKIDKIPCVVNDYPGFIANRILMPMINEAIYSLYEGVAGVVEIDTIMKLGMAHPMGPLQLADFIGLDVCFSILNVLHTGFGNPKYAPCPLLSNMVSAGHLGVKTGQGFYQYEEGSKALKVGARFR
jgi:3-hydroxybutyryl-CoA dehydrogenase